MISLVALLVFTTVLLIVHGYVMSEMFTDSRALRLLVGFGQTTACWVLGGLLFWSMVGAK